MDLVQKGQTAELESITGIKLTASWTEAADLDIAALYEAKDGRKGMVYFGSKGDLNGFPHMKLDKDAGVGDKGGANQETMKIAKLDDMKIVHLCIWDYGNVQKGEPGRFGGTVKVELVDNNSTSHAVKLDGNPIANVVVIATIDNSSPIGAKLINTSKSGVLKGLSNSQQILDIANS